jgi:uncharacterized repeat protein (TIGR01451 family)
MSQKFPLARNPRRSFALFFTWSLGLGLILLVLAYAVKTPAAGAKSLPAQANPEAPHDIQAVDLKIGKEGPDSAWAGQFITYTISITNNKGATINGVVVTDTWAASEQGALAEADMQPVFNGVYWTVPEGIVSAFYHDPEAQSIRWELDPLPAGFNGQIEFAMQIPEALQPLHARQPWNVVGPSTLGNSAGITGTDVSANAPDQVVTAIQGPIFKLEKFITTEPGVGPRPGRLITYELRLDNLERLDAVQATDIVIGETLPDALVYQDAWANDDPGATVAYDPANRHITWTLSSNLNVGEALTVTFLTRLSPTQNWKRTIYNNSSACWAIANELATPVECWSSVSVSTLGIFDKTYITEPSDLDEDETFQNRYITYTIYVFNPLSQTLVHNLRVTDVMPLGWDFVRMVEGNDPVWPTGEITHTMAWEWPGEALQPNGMLHFTFVAHIGPDTDFSNASCREPYYNDLAGSADEFPIVYQYGETFNRFEDGLAKVYVVEQIKLAKSVTSGRGGSEDRKQVPGGIVTYTIGLENIGDRVVTDIMLTDTLPTYFRFARMVSGPPPTSIVTSTVFLPTKIVWDIGDMAPGEERTLRFEAIVDGVWETTLPYYNYVGGYSPDTKLCTRKDYGVTVLSPTVFEKDAIPPLDGDEWVVQWEWFQYDIRYWNRSILSRYRINAFGDWLPDGFEVDGEQLYEPDPVSIGLPFTLPVNMSGNWQHIFDVDTPGAGTGSDWCDDLRIDEDSLTNQNRRRELYQEEGAAAISVEPVDFPGEEKVAITGAKSGYMLFKPHVDLRQIVYPKKASINSTVQVTLTLHNNMRDYHSGTVRALSNAVVTYNIPNDFSFAAVIPPTPAPDVQTSEMLVWHGLSLDAGEHQQTHLRFTLQSPSEVIGSWSTGRAQAMPQDPSICIPRSEAKYYAVKGIEIAKTPDSSSVGPFGTVVYDLELINRTTAPVTGLTITDTLPEGFEFIAVLPGSPEPDSINPLVWRDLEVEASSVSGLPKKLLIQYQVRASGLFGIYYNQVDGVSDSTFVTHTEDYHEDVAVGVLPGVALYKLVQSEQAEAGDTAVYTLTVDNRSGDDIVGVRITDVLPSNFSYQGMLSGDAPIITSPDLVWTVNLLENNTKREFVFRATIDAQTPNGCYCNRASATAFEEADPTQPVSIPDTDLTACIDVEGIPTIHRAKTVSPSEVEAGAWVTYTITLYNEMESSQTLRLTDTLPLSITYVGVGALTPAPVLTSPVVWEGLEIDVQQAMTLTLLARVDPLAPSGVYYNRLDAATDEAQLPPMTQLARLQVMGIPRYDLQVTKSDGQIRAEEGEVLQYTIVCTNVNDDDLTLTNVVLTDTFDPPPPHADFYLGLGWTQVAENVYAYDVGDLAPGESRAIDLSIKLSDTVPFSVAVISNVVEIGHSTAQQTLETDLVNNRFTDLDILHGIDLVVTGLNVSPAEPQAGAPMVFSVTVRNRGTISTLNALGAPWFPVELYLKEAGFEPSGPPGAVYSPAVFDHFGGWCADYPDCNETRAAYLITVTNGLGGNDDETTLQFEVSVAQGGEYDVYVQVDTSFEHRSAEPWGHAYGVIQEVIETNNVYAYGTLQVGDSGEDDFYLYLPVIVKDD